MAPIVATHQQTAMNEAYRNHDYGVTRKPAAAPKATPPHPAQATVPAPPGLMLTPAQAEQLAYETKMRATMAHMRAQDEVRRARRKKAQ